MNPGRPIRRGEVSISAPPVRLLRETCKGYESSRSAITSRRRHTRQCAALKRKPHGAGCRARRAKWLAAARIAGGGLDVARGLDSDRRARSPRAETRRGSRPRGRSTSRSPAGSRSASSPARRAWPRPIARRFRVHDHHLRRASACRAGFSCGRPAAAIASAYPGAFATAVRKWALRCVQDPIE